MKRIIAICLITCSLLLPVYADKSSVKLSLVGQAVKGKTVTLKVDVSHDGNNFFHYTDLVLVKAGGKEIARWTFTRSSRPESENFSREVELGIDGPVDIEAMADCNIHGSAGPAVLHIEPEK